MVKEQKIKSKEIALHLYNAKNKKKKDKCKT